MQNYYGGNDMEERVLSVRVPASIAEAMDRAIEAEGFKNQAEFVRAALRKYLREGGYLRGDEE